MTIPQVACGNATAIESEFVPGRLQGGRLVIEIEHGEESERALASGPGSDPHAHLLEAGWKVLHRMIVAGALIDSDDIPVGEQRTRLLVELRQIGPQNQWRARHGEQCELGALLLQTQARVSRLAPPRVWRQHAE